MWHDIYGSLPGEAGFVRVEEIGKKNLTLKKKKKKKRGKKSFILFSFKFSHILAWLESIGGILPYISSRCSIGTKQRFLHEITGRSQDSHTRPLFLAGAAQS